MATLLEQLRASLGQNMDNEERCKVETAITLLEAYQKYSNKSEFHVGDAVRWKRGLKYRSVPKEDEVGVVTEVLEKPIYDPTVKSAGEQLYREPLTLRVALVFNSMCFEFYLDGSRLEVVPPDQLTPAQRDQADTLRNFAEKLTMKREQLKPGDVVRWKAGMKNAKRPDYGQKCVVIEAYPAYRSERRGACATGFLEPNDVRIALIDSDSDVMLFTFDSRRFETVPESEL